MLQAMAAQGGAARGHAAQLVQTDALAAARALAADCQTACEAVAFFVAERFPLGAASAEAPAHDAHDAAALPRAIDAVWAELGGLLQRHGTARTEGMLELQRGCPMDALHDATEAAGRQRASQAAPSGGTASAEEHAAQRENAAETAAVVVAAEQDEEEVVRRCRFAVGRLCDAAAAGEQAMAAQAWWAVGWVGRVGRVG